LLTAPLLEAALVRERPLLEELRPELRAEPERDAAVLRLALAPLAAPPLAARLLLAFDALAVRLLPLALAVRPLLFALAVRPLLPLAARLLALRFALAVRPPAPLAELLRFRACPLLCAMLVPPRCQSGPSRWSHARQWTETSR
jgi:hypothetical protein